MLWSGLKTQWIEYLGNSEMEMCNNEQCVGEGGGGGLGERGGVREGAWGKGEG